VKARRRRILGGLPQTRRSLFLTATRREAITLATIGMLRHTHFVERKIILRHLAGRSKPYATSPNDFKGKRTRGLLQTNNKLIGMGRK
jgi:hypothetical protein